MKTLRILFAACAALLLAAQASAESPSVETAAIQDVISRQIDAFRAEDAAAAFAFAAPGIQERFGDAATFIRMVKSGYGAIYRAADIRFGKIGGHHGVILQQVDVTADDGEQVRAIYAMEKQPDGQWRIAGCQIVEPDGLET
ncbi:MAG: DUF4864 domain-containing protein, partial [Pseudomonadota bacterium]